MAASSSPLITAFPDRNYGQFQYDLEEKIKSEDVAQRRRGVAMRKQLGENLAAIEKERIEKMKQFENECKQKVAEYDSRVRDEETKLKTKHAEEHAAFMEKLKVETDPKVPHGSQEYFRSRKIEELLFQQKRYPEAQEHKQRAESLAKQDHSEWEDARNKRIKAHEEPYLLKQQQAVASHRQRSEASRLELLSKNQAEKEKIVRHYDAKRAHMEEQHHFEMRKHEIYPGSTLNFANSLVLKKKLGEDAEAESRAWTVP